MRGALTRLLLVVLNPQPAQAGKRAVKRKKRNLFVDDEVEVDDASDEVCGVRQRRSRLGDCTPAWRLSGQPATR